MDTEILWQLIDTSVKIGIGMVLATMFMLLILHRKTSGRPVNAEKRRLDILETIAADVGNVSHSFAKYSTLTVESIRFGKHWPDSRKQELDSVSTQLAIEFKKLSDAESKLLMLGEKTLEKTLRLYGSKVAQFRRQVYIGREDISEDDILSMKRDINLLREQFYDFLSKKYDRLLTA
ncbi:MAG: energy transducer TonB [Cellvibrionaceae bacterium]|nr:energy transducer TonB [Cellvibrionaceae bacterium]